MSIQSFAEKLLSVMDASFAKEANDMANAARQRTGAESYIVGRMDGLHLASDKIKEVYALFVRTEKEKDDDDAKPLY